MKTADYASFTRHAMLHAYMEMLESTPDDEIINEDFEIISHQHPEVDRENFNRAITEGMGPADVMRIMGLPMTAECPHCGHEQELEDEDPEETDEVISESFNDIVSEVVSRPGGTVVLSYSYCDDDSFDADKIRGCTMVFGDRDTVDILQEILEDTIEECTDKDGFVNTSSCDSIP